MKIYYTFNLPKLSELKIGDCFYCKRDPVKTIYMRTTDDTKTAVNVLTGELENFPLDIEVVEVDAYAKVTKYDN